jgi:hypothetical protein
MNRASSQILLANPKAHPTEPQFGASDMMLKPH